MRIRINAVVKSESLQTLQVNPKLHNTAGVSSTIAAIAVVVVVAVAGVGYYTFIATSKATQPSSSSLGSSSSSPTSTSSYPSSSTSTTEATMPSVSTSSTQTSTTITTSVHNSNPACGTPAPGTTTVKVGMGGDPTGFFFKPISIIVVIGVNSTVEWVNTDIYAPHTVTSSSPSPLAFDSGNMNRGQMFTCSFTTPGTYNYRCTYHPEMQGVVTVKSP